MCWAFCAFDCFFFGLGRWCGDYKIRLFESHWPLGRSPDGCLGNVGQGEYLSHPGWISTFEFFLLSAASLSNLMKLAALFTAGCLGGVKLISTLATFSSYTKGMSSCFVRQIAILCIQAKWDRPNGGF